MEYKRHQTENLPWKPAEEKLPGPAAGKAAPVRGEAAYSRGAVMPLPFCMGYGREGAGALRSRGRTSNAGFQA